MTAITQALSTALLHFVWQGIAVALILWIALFLLRKRSANSRYLASCAALGILAVLPAITTWMAYAPPGGLTTERHVTLGAAPLQPAEFGPLSTSKGDWLRTIQSWALPAWSLGVLLFSLRLVWGCREVSRLRRRGEPAEASLISTVAGLGIRLGLYRPVRVLITAASDGPSVVGWLRPVILLPSATLMGLSTGQLEAVLAHELAHVRRYDYLVNFAQTLVETLLFYHPAVWWTSARIRQERELCCDDLAVRSCGDAVCYARALTVLERLRMTTPSLALGSTGGSLLDRVQRLLGAGSREYGPSKLSGILAFSLGLACIALNLQWARAQERESPDRHLYLNVSGQASDAPGVSVDLAGAAILHRSSVEYPHAAIEKRVQGMVVVEATLDAAGNVDDARVLSGPAELRRVALQSVLEWHFLPGKNGSVRQVSMQFELAAAQNHEGQREEGAREVAFGVAGARETFAFRTRDAVSSPEADARLERELLELRARRAKVQDSLAPQQDPETQNHAKAELVELAAKIADRERALAEQPRGETIAVSRSQDQGRVEIRTRARMESTLRSIDVLGLAEPVRAQLVSRLPVHLGDTLSPEVMERIEKAVRSFDEHLELNLEPAEDGQGTSLLIRAPNGGGFVTLRVK